MSTNAYSGILLYQKKQPTLWWTQFIPQGVIFNVNFANTLILFQDTSSCTNRNGWDHVKLISPFKLSLFTFTLEQSNKHWKQFKKLGITDSKISSLKRLSIISAASTLRDIQILLSLSLVWKVFNKLLKPSFLTCCLHMNAILDDIFQIQDWCEKKQ